MSLADAARELDVSPATLRRRASEPFLARRAAA